MPKKYYIYDNTPIEFPTSSGIAYNKFIASNDHLVGSEVTEAEYLAALGDLQIEEKRQQRAEAYIATHSDGDQIDAIMKGFDALANNEALPQELLDIIADRKQIKIDIPLS